MRAPRSLASSLAAAISSALSSLAGISAGISAGPSAGPPTGPSGSTSAGITDGPPAPPSARFRAARLAVPLVLPLAVTAAFAGPAALAVPAGHPAARAASQGTPQAGPGAAARPSGPSAADGPNGRGGSGGPGVARAAAGVGAAGGANRSLRLAPLTVPSGRAAGETPQGIASRTVRPFSLLGVTWNDASAALHGTVRVRTRSLGTHRWSAWRALPVSDDLPDPGSPDRTGRRARGGTAPLWVGDADGVQVRVAPRSADRAAGPAELPHGLRVDLVDPGRGSPHGNGGAAGDQVPADRASNTAGRAAPMPRIVSRAGWGADETLRESGFAYTGAVRALFVHHTATDNDYACADSPSIVRAIYRYHVLSEGWRDIGYNFLIDRCGTVYEGRAGGVTRSVEGAHTLGFNTATTGVALLGDFDGYLPSRASVRALETLAAWKLGLTGVSATGTAILVANGSDQYPDGDRVRFAAISGHRDAYLTDCPGEGLYGLLPQIRRAAATLQAGRSLPPLR